MLHGLLRRRTEGRRLLLRLLLRLQHHALLLQLLLHLLLPHLLLLLLLPQLRLLLLRRHRHGRLPLRLLRLLRRSCARGGGRRPGQLR